MFENHLKQQHPHEPTINYDVSQLFEFVDSLADLSCLVYQVHKRWRGVHASWKQSHVWQAASGHYIPHNKEWIKEKMILMLQRQASQ
jgi:hypothetical protein